MALFTSCYGCEMSLFLTGNSRWQTRGGWLALVALAAFPAFSSDPYPEQTGSQLVVYLEIPTGSAKEVELDLGKVFLVGEKDSILLVTGPRTLAAGKGHGGQTLLCQQAIPPGRFLSLRMLFNRVTAYAQAARIQPSAPEQGITIPIDLSALPGQTVPVFLLWNPGLDAIESKAYLPFIKAQEVSRVPPASLAIVSNTGSDYLTCIDRFRMKVVNVLPARRRPTDMIYASSRQEFYVANSASDDISVLDIHTGKVKRTLGLRGGDEPSRLALSTDQRRLYVLNGASNSVSIINLLSHQEEGRIQLEAAPSSLAVDGQNDAVYVTSRDSDQLSAIDPGSMSVTSLLRFGSSLDELALNRKDRRLYVVKTAQRQISIVDLARNAVIGDIKLCAPATGFAYHPISRTLFAAIRECSLIAILKPDENLELGSINLPHAPGRISLDPESKNLFVTFPAQGKVALYNANSWKRQVILDVGKQPFSVAFAQ